MFSLTGPSARRARALAAALIAAGSIAALTPAAPAYAGVGGSFLSFSAPLTDSVGFVTGMVSCGGIGPVGTRVESTRVFVVNYCEHKLYRFPATGGDLSDSGIVSEANGFNGGLTKLGSTYYAVIQDGADGGIWTFDPDTLARGTKIVGLPSGAGNVRDVLADEIHGDLWYSANNGLYRLHAADSPATPHKVADGDFDGVGINGDGSVVYAASLGNVVQGFNSTTEAEVLHVSIPGSPGIDGIASAGADLYVNSNDGTIERIDGTTHDVTVVASGGSRGDFVTVGADGSLYATQSNSVVKMIPNIFDPAPTSPRPTASTPEAHPGPLPTTGFGTAKVVMTGLVVVAAGLALLVGTLIWRRRTRRG